MKKSRSSMITGLGFAVTEKHVVIEEVHLKEGLGWREITTRKIIIPERKVQNESNNKKGKKNNLKTTIILSSLISLGIAAYLSNGNLNVLVDKVIPILQFVLNTILK